jgi:hypothetical protein
MIRSAKYSKNAEPTKTITKPPQKAKACALGKYSCVSIIRAIQLAIENSQMKTLMKVGPLNGLASV